ncbi:unnamed protein product [Nezara viridula]|uniref:tRNA N(3)-methylcytidine methyltransferase n=1 Tax=Nezara viridula TaxID=85310 RepID=A0A9P0HGP8_NEZVI|nr:unnamed protein product [Nezara viridula]
MKFDDELETCELKVLESSDLEKLAAQNSRLLPSWQANKLEAEAKKHWDLFYKRNENRFFKDRHWTTREFKELLQIEDGGRKSLLEVGCGTGNLIYPLLEEGLNLEFWVCDISPRALDIVRQHPLYSEDVVHTVLADITQPGSLSTISEVNIVTLVFVLSALHPTKMKDAVLNICSKLKPGGTLLFRDYARWDMTQLRFGPGRKIEENFYARQDGTRSYFFTIEEVDELFREGGLSKISNVYIKRRTINKKENIDVPRYFVQAKYTKPHSANT